MNGPPNRAGHRRRRRLQRRRARRRRILRHVVTTIAALTLLGSIAAGIWLFHGGWRLTTVTTPSMSPAVPVGSLVITAPLGKPARVGELLVFRPPGNIHTYVHRVVAVGAGPTYRTKGDNDGRPDSWSVPSTSVIGHSVLVIPALGWLVTSAPLLAVALVAAAVVGYLLPRWRRWAVIDAICAAILLVSLRVHPFVRWQVITVTHSATRAAIQLFNTGLLPIAVRALPGSAATVAPGHSATLTGPLGHPITILGATHFTAWQWSAMTAVCALPAAVAIVLTRPRSSRSACHRLQMT